jgi:hypothetical protein
MDTVELSLKAIVGGIHMESGGCRCVTVICGDSVDD